MSRPRRGSVQPPLGCAGFLVSLTSMGLTFTGGYYHTGKSGCHLSAVPVGARQSALPGGLKAQAALP